MKPCNDYPINFPYGATSYPYSPTHPHRGDDRACPTGTPIMVGSRIIGLVGSTGLTTGSHLHLQEWKGDVANTRKPQNSFGGGVVTATGTGKQWGNYITITKDGWNSTYCHLSKINVQTGQKIGEGMEEDGVRYGYLATTMAQPTKAQLDYWINRHPTEFTKALYGLSDEYLVARTKEVARQSVTIQKQGVVITEQQALINGQKLEIAELADENAKLKAQLTTCGDNQDTDYLNKLGEILRWLINRLGLKG